MLLVIDGKKFIEREFCAGLSSGLVRIQSGIVLQLQVRGFALCRCQRKLRVTTQGCAVYAATELFGQLKRFDAAWIDDQGQAAMPIVGKSLPHSGRCQVVDHTFCEMGFHFGSFIQSNPECYAEQ